MLFSTLSSKTLLAFIPLLILPYSFNTEALSAISANTIQGTAPYLTFDGGTTKVTTTDGLLSITLSDTTTTPATDTIITASSNASTVTNPYMLPVAGQTFADVGMLVPPTASGGSITLNNLINTYNYWGDDDGDGQGAGGVSATGSLSVVITDNNNQTVNRSDTLDICNAPYKVVLSSTAGSLSTQYGDPQSTGLASANATYYISPQSVSTVCFAKPITTSLFSFQYAGPATMWNTTNGFIPQSTYGSNFPATGANGLYFDLIIAGVDATTLTWNASSHSGITVAIDPTFTTSTSVRYKITGPASTLTQQTAATPTTVHAPVLPQQFELTGALGSVIKIKYGFELQQWFVNRGDEAKPSRLFANTDTMASWCNSIGYRLPTVGDLTNASGISGGLGGTIPFNPLASGGNYATRHINAGLFAEWGPLSNYPDANFSWDGYWTSDPNGKNQFYVGYDNGRVETTNWGNRRKGVCVNP